MESVAEHAASRDRLAIVAALEACEVSDYRLAVEILLGALEDVGPSPVLLCPKCGIDCHWPGRLEAHLCNVHGVSEELAA
jgi:hypothetical protein